MARRQREQLQSGSGMKRAKCLLPDRCQADEGRQSWPDARSPNTTVSSPGRAIDLGVIGWWPPADRHAGAPAVPDGLTWRSCTCNHSTASQLVRAVKRDASDRQDLAGVSSSVLTPLDDPLLADR